MIRRGDLVLLKDDAAFFPRYDAVWLFRLDAGVAAPGIPCRNASAGREPSPRPRCKRSTMRSKRAQDGDEAAADFLTQQLGLHVEVQTASRTQMITKHILDHLDLVRRSLLPAIVVGIAFSNSVPAESTHGRVVLAGVGLLQTIPSLARPFRCCPSLRRSLPQHRGRLGDGRDGPFLLLPVAHRQEHVHGPRRHSAARSISHGSGTRANGAARRDRVADRLADSFGRHSHFGRPKRGLCDAGRHGSVAWASRLRGSASMTCR